MQLDADRLMAGLAYFTAFCSVLAAIALAFAFTRLVTL
jgi:hypothetical protein